MLGRVFNMLGRLPLNVLRTIGAVLGSAAWFFSSGYKTKLLKNIAQAYPNASSSLPRLALRQMFEMYAELPFIWSGENEIFLKRLNGSLDWSPIERRLSMGQGAILMSAHVGSYEWLLPLFALDHQVTVIYKPSKKRWLQTLIENTRVRANLKMVPANRQGVKVILQDLALGRTVGLLVDHLPDLGSGVYAPFFNKLAYTSVLPQRLQIATGCPIFTVGLQRLSRPVGYRLHIAELEAPLNACKEIAAAQINAQIECLIRQMPDQYLWGYNRYKMPVKAPKVFDSQEQHGSCLPVLKLWWCRAVRRCPILVRKRHANDNDIVITIDDGPNSDSTPQLLQMLKTHRRKAVFFVVGERATEHPDLLRKIVEDGHQVYAHGWSHVRMDKHNSNDIMVQMNRCESLLSEIRPTPSPYLVRLPFNAGYRKVSVHKALMKWRGDCHIVHWAINPRDYLYPDLLASASDWRAELRSMMRRVVAERRGPGAIILLHDQPYGVVTRDIPVADLTIETMQSFLESMNEFGLNSAFL